ncbi:ion channel [Paenibacillus gansuensis]|uniref:Ion channel n=1 Tax=Paenibacillus gansuensis TaxID=306542 RepID=A0ABW5PAD8_9BACL
MFAIYTIRKLAAWIRKFNTASLVTSAVVLVLLSSCVIRLLEPDRFPSLFTAVWYVMTTVTTVGYGDLYPETVPGKLVAMLLFLLGIGLIGVVIGKVVDGFAAFTRRKEEGRMDYQGRNHIVMIGWSKKTQIAVDEVLDSDNAAEVVLIDELERAPLQRHRFHYIQGDPTDPGTLRRANAAYARSAILFADERIQDASLVDGKSLLVASTIESLAPNVYTTVEIMQEKHIPNFQHAKVNDFILSQETISRLAVRSALTSGITSLYNRLIRKGEEAGEGELYEVRPSRVWRTYGDAFEALLAEGATLIGDQHHLGVTQRLGEELPKDAKLYVLCEEKSYRIILSKYNAGGEA